MVKVITLSRNKTTTIPDELFEEITKFKWCAIETAGKFYAVRNRDGKEGKGHLVYLHREVWMLANGPIPQGLMIDHIDGNGLNNDLSNLRICTCAQNQRNQKIRVHSSQYKGVSRCKGYEKWTARIFFMGKHIHLGRFDEEKDAASAYDSKARELFGIFARPNFA
jgi:hypothetical protein